jgi:prepilin-type N-terminal cleavage/methylation domain-containing protein
MKNHKTAFSLLEISIVIAVIGLLIAGITAGLKIVENSKLKTARALSQSSVVNGLSGLVFWLDATAEGVIVNSDDSYKVSDGNRIKTIRDNNPGSINFTLSEATSGGGPTYAKNGIGGLPSLYFNGSADTETGDCLTMPFSKKLDPLNFTLFFVTKPMVSISSSIASIYSNILPSGSTGGLKVFQYSSGDFYWTFRLRSLAGNSSTVNAVNIGDPTVLTVTHNEPPSSSTLVNKLHQKGNLAFNDNSRYHNINEAPESGENIQIGCCYIASFTQFYNGYISEIILFNRALPDEDRIEVEKYLMKKYNIK